MFDILEGLEGVLCHMDDILMFGRNEEEYDTWLEATVIRIGDAGITLNSGKCKFRQNQVKFLGYVIDKDGIHAEPDKVKSVTNIKAPTNISEIYCSWRIVNQLSNLAELTQLLRELLSEKMPIFGAQIKRKLLNKSKKKLSKSTVLANMTWPQIQRYQLIPRPMV